MNRPLGTAEAGIAGSRVVVVLAGERFALPIEVVEGVAPPPPLARVPHSVPALLGAGHLGGRIVPIVDLAHLLGLARGPCGYDGTGEVLRLRVAGGGVGLWVDKVERVIDAADEPEIFDAGGVRLIDPIALLAGGLNAPELTVLSQAPLGQAGQIAAEAPVRPPAPAFIVVEAGGKPVALPRQAVQELVAAVAWTPVPRAPDGFLGVGLLRGTVLPVLSLATLLGLGGGADFGGFFSVDVGGRRALIAVDRIIGLRFQPAEAEIEPVDVAAAIGEQLRHIILGFSPDEDDRRGDPGPGETDAYLAFMVAGLECALPAECVDRIIGPQPLIRLPHLGANGSAAALLDGAIELRGQVLPVAALHRRLNLVRTPGQEPQAYVILRDADGLGAIGIDQTRQLIELQRSDIVPAPGGEHGALAGVVAQPGGGLLRIIAPDRLWSGA